MALIQCKECGKPVSTEAVVCPHCGAPQREPASPPVQPPPLIQQKAGVPEETIYSDKVVTVTTTRVIVWETTYALRNITSVRMVKTPRKIGCAFMLLMLGALVLLGAFVQIKDGMKVPVGVFIPTGAMIVGAIVWFCAARLDYHVDISSASGEVHALTSKDKAYIQRIVQSINEAIVKYQ